MWHRGWVWAREERQHCATDWNSQSWVHKPHLSPQSCCNPSSCLGQCGQGTFSSQQLDLLQALMHWHQLGSLEMSQQETLEFKRSLEFCFPLHANRTVLEISHIVHFPTTVSKAEDSNHLFHLLILKEENWDPLFGHAGCSTPCTPVNYSRSSGIYLCSNKAQLRDLREANHLLSP